MQISVKLKKERLVDKNYVTNKRYYFLLNRIQKEELNWGNKFRYGRTVLDWTLSERCREWAIGKRKVLSRFKRNSKFSNAKATKAGTCLCQLRLKDSIFFSTTSLITTGWTFCVLLLDNEHDLMRWTVPGVSHPNSWLVENHAIISSGCYSVQARWWLR